MKTIFKFFVAAFAALVMVGCSDNDDTLNGVARTPQGYVPTSSSSVDVIFSDGTTEPARWQWQITAEDTIKVQGTEGIKSMEQLSKTAASELHFAYNYAISNLVKVTGLAMPYTYEGKSYTLYPRGGMQVRGSRQVQAEKASPFYEESATVYTLEYNGIQLASAKQMFVVDEGYVPAWVCNQWFTRHNAFVREATRSNNVVSVKCNNIATFWQLFDDNSHRDSANVNYTVVNKFNMVVPDITVEDKTTLYNKSFAFTAETATVQGSNIKAEWQSAAIQEKIPYNGVEYKDSIAPCVAVAKNLVFNADATAITVYFFDKDHEVSTDYATVSIPVTVKETVKFKELVKEFKHNAFRSNATVSGNNIAVLCDNTATFQKTYTDGSKGKAESVKYVVTNNFTYGMPANMPVVAKGKTYTFNSTTAVVEGKNVTVTFASRVIGDIVYENTNYKSDKAVPQCEVAVKNITFGNTTATITFTHDKETVTATVPVTYNGLNGYERVGDPVHDSWNAAYGTSNGFGITCNNHVVVREMMTDGSKGNSFDLPYKSTNTWTVSGKTSFEVSNLANVLNVRYEVVNGSTATIENNTINFSHSMSAEKVSKGTFSYQPSACEAVAKYITVTSSTTARVDIYHDNTKVGEVVIPVNITEKHNPDFQGEIVYGWATDSYTDGSNGVASREGTYFHFVVVNNGAYTVYSRKVGQNAWKASSITSAEVNKLSKSKPLAWTGKTVSGYRMGQITAAVKHSSGKGYIIEYSLLNGSVDRRVGMSGATFTDEYRDPIRGTWTNGTIVVDGVTYKVTASK